jgi:hypothetical protein
VAFSASYRTQSCFYLLDTDIDGLGKLAFAPATRIATGPQPSQSLFAVFVLKLKLMRDL